MRRLAAAATVRVRQVRMTLAGGWHDIRPVAARVAAPMSEACRAQVAALRATLRARR